MKKLLQTITLGLMVSFLFTTVGFGQALVEQSNKAPAQAEMQSKDAELLWGENWQDPAESTNGIVSTYFGALDPPLTISADDFLIPAGETWDITSVWTRGFLSRDDDGVPWAEADGYAFRIYADDDGQPGDMLHEVEFEQDFEEGIVEMDLAEPITLTEGAYWISTYGLFFNSSNSEEGRWNQYMWNPLPEGPMEEPMLRDYAGLFGMADDGWVKFSDIGLNFEALDFAIWGVLGDPDAEYHTVTFNVDMTDAVAEGDVEFNPEVHHVWITGTFADWAEPGSNDDFMLAPLPPAKDSEIVLFYEDFGPGNESGELPEGWEVKKADNYEGNDLQDVGDLGDEAQWFRYSETYDPLNFDDQYVRTGESSMWVTWNVSGVQNAYALSPEINIPAGSEDVMLEFWKHFDGWVDPDSGDEWFTHFILLIHSGGEWQILDEFIGNEDTQNHFDEPVIMNLTAYAGEEIRLGFVKSWNDGIQMAIDDIKITALVDDDPVESEFYTITLDVEEGDHEYKYFLVEDSPTWGIGEWEGDPNRQITVTADMEQHDIFGVLGDVSILEPAEIVTNIYPNPASSVINVVTEQSIENIRVFDLSGRMIMNMDVQDAQHAFDVSSLLNGMYIMQVRTAEGVQSSRFTVAK